MDSLSPLRMDSVIRKMPNLVASEVNNNLVILSIEQGRFYGIEVVGKRIWELLSQVSAINDICDVLMDEFDVQRETCEQEVFRFLDELYRENLIEIV